MQCIKRAKWSEDLPVLLPLCNLFLRFLARDAISVVDAADQLLAIAGDDVEVIIGELAPLLLGLALEDLPIAFDAIPVHGVLLCMKDCGNGRGEHACSSDNWA